jgi:hypothetical protein
VTLVLEALGGNEALDLGGLGVWLRALLLGLNLTANNELADLNNIIRQTRLYYNIEPARMGV